MMKLQRFFVVAVILLLGTGSVYAACGTCNWYGSNWPVCCNQNTGWGWENSASCIGCTDCINAGQSCSSCSKCAAGTTTTTTAAGTTSTTAAGSTTTTAAGTTTTTSGGGGTKYITATIVVNGTTYDGGGQTIVAQGMGDGSQDEDQDPIFKVTNGTVKNVKIAAPGCDGIHCYGNCRIENVTWQDVGEDALTIKGTGTTVVSGGSAQNATDKVFQLNQACTFTVENFSANTFGCFIRQNGGTTFTCTIYINGVSISNGDYGVRTDSSSTQIYYRNFSVSNVDHQWQVPNQSSQVHSY